MILLGHVASWERLWREKYGLHDPTMPTRDSIDSRVKYGNRVLSLFHMITYLAGALYPLEKENMGFIYFIFSSLFLVGSQIILQIILIVISEYIVQYDKKFTMFAADQHEANTILKESLDTCGADLIRARKDNSNLQNRIIILKDEIENESARNEILENIIDIKNKDIYRLYNRLDDVKDEKKEITKKLLEIIESNSKHILEVDYIVIMDLLKKLHE